MLNRSLAVLLVLATTLVASMAFTTTAALAGYISECEGRCEGGQSNVPDACPEMAGMQNSAAECVAPAPAPEEAPAPAPTPDEGFIAPAPEEFEHGSLTIQTAQNDPAATSGPEITLGAADAPGAAPGGGTSSTSAVSLPSGSLPYTGASAIEVAILAVSLLWLGILGYVAGAVLRRRDMVADAA